MEVLREMLKEKKTGFFSLAGMVLVLGERKHCFFLLRCLAGAFRRKLTFLQQILRPLVAWEGEKEASRSACRERGVKATRSVGLHAAVGVTFSHPCGFHYFSHCMKVCMCRVRSQEE